MEAHSSVCRNNVCSFSLVKSEHSGAVGAKVDVQKSLCPKYLCNSVFHDLNNNTMHVSVQNDPGIALDTCSKT